MPTVPFKSVPMFDALLDFNKGVNAGYDYTLLPKTQLASAHNSTVRGALIGPRPYVRKLAMIDAAYSRGGAVARVEAGRYQGGCFYRPDAGLDSLVASISGHLYRFAISGNTAMVSDVSCVNPTTGLPDYNDPDQMRNWLWQAEKWVIVTDGTYSPPLFYDGVSTVRSNYGIPTNYQAKHTVEFYIPEIGANVDITLNNTTGLINGTVITHRYRGQFKVLSVNVGTGKVTCVNLSATPKGFLEAVQADPNDKRFSWVVTGTQLPPGRMGVYGMGRNWMSLVDGKQFVASDLVGGSSGTIDENFRDAVLQITENQYLAGGGNFAVPGSYGDIRAMCFSETLDSSLGQGALQVFTPNSVFSCNAPVDRTTWQELTTPILTESSKGGGGLSQWSTVNSNSDILSRDYNGIRSLVLSRREFNTWGNVPSSREIQPQLDEDSEDLLGYSSAAVFDNRHIMTTRGEVVEGRGVIWKRLTAKNHDPFSTLAGKEPALYDALYWDGLDIFQLIRAEINQTQRLFAFTLNKLEDKIELWEILKSSSGEIVDNGERRVVWSFESAAIDFGQKDPRTRLGLRLGQSEIGVNALRGKVTFEAYFRPEHWPCWVPWAAWEECQQNTDSTTHPGFRPNMGLPEPSGEWSDTCNNRPLREGYFFQVKLVVTGHCKITSWKLTANTVPQPDVAPPVCDAICP